jgi:hypothetical protein
MFFDSGAFMNEAALIQLHSVLMQLGNDRICRTLMTP